MGATRGRARRRRRLDEELVAQGFFNTTDEALRAVLAGEVSGCGRRFSTPGEQVERGSYLQVRGRRAYVSRGGIKLARGLDAFQVDPKDLVCLDVGCSTGGFTDCLLKRGASRVVAVDVGYAQFSWELRGDPRVTLLERTNVVSLIGTTLESSFDLAVCDVSFTSVRTVLPAVSALLKSQGRFLTLVKPQFEVARDQVGPGGVVADEPVRRAAVATVRDALEAAGYEVAGVCESPITGHKGNVEYLMMATRG